MNRSVPHSLPIATTAKLILTLWCYLPGVALAAYITDASGCKAFNPRPLENESIRWSGACKDGYLDGQGVLEWYLNGVLRQRVEGFFRVGKPSGRMVVTFPLEGNKRCEGIWDEQGQRKGSVVCTKPAVAEATPVPLGLSDCRVVDQAEVVSSYDTKFYHSEGLALFPELTNPKPFCRDYSAPKEQVSRIVAAIVPRLGNRILVADPENGVFTTDIIERGHIGGKWQDSYSITISEEAPSHTAVRVLRTLHIRRDKKFRQHPSDGHNEKWVLTQIANGIASGQGSNVAAPGGATSTAGQQRTSEQIEAELQKLDELKRKGVISEEEYGAMRKKVLGL